MRTILYNIILLLEGLAIIIVGAWVIYLIVKERRMKNG